MPGPRNGGNVLKNIINNFLDSAELARVWQQFRHHPRWEYRVLTGGVWFWWYRPFGDGVTFRHDNADNIWESCLDPIWHEIYQKIMILAGPGFVPYRYIINGQTESQDGSPHSDFAKNKDNHSTFLLYLNQIWDPSWDGATEFFNNRTMEIRHRELPEPGKIVHYDSRITHRGTPPKAKNVLRVTLAVQGEHT